MTGAPTLLGVPYDAGSSFLRGPANAPGLVRRALASPSTNTWTECLRDVAGMADAGDVAFGDSEPREAITAALAQILEMGGKPIAIGGDHSITYPLLIAMRARHPKLTVLHADAHADLYDSFDGDRHSHACPFARIMEDRLADRLVQVGVRTLNAHQRQQAERYGVEIIGMREFATGARPAVDGPVYLSVDLDVLDPACAPGVSHWEPGGMTTRELITVIQDCGGRLVGADVVEYNPGRDPAGITAAVAAKIVKEIASRMLEPC